MSKIKPHRPAFFDTDFEREAVKFDTISELLKIPWVAIFSCVPSFHQFSISPDGDKWLLMAEYNKGSKWHVVGFMDEKVDLPEWVTTE
jgi:hypothetical protein